MTNPDDPRTPQERAYDPAEQASDETVQWARPADDVTQQMGPVATPAPDQPTEQYYTADPYQAYGSPPPNATQAFPTYDPRFDPQGPPPNATQAYPTYYGAGGYPPGGYPPPGQPPTGEVPPNEDTPGGPKKKVGLWAAAGAGVVLLALGLIVGLMLNGNDAGDSDTAAQLPRTSVPVVPPRATPAPTDEPDTSLFEDLDLPGGVEDLIGKAGTVMGTITANDGGTLTVDGLGGSTVTVRTTSDTTLISLTADSVADLEPGKSVLVQGDKAENDLLTANLIIDTTLPEFGN